MSQAPTSLRCEYLTEPIGIGERMPRLSWVLRDDTRGAGQKGYQIQAAGSRDALVQGKPDLWDSGEVKSARSSQVVYSGEPLGGTREVWWRVRVWDESGPGPGPYSEPARFEMGLLAAADWAASWINSGELRDDAQPAVYLRRGFDLPSKKVKKARIYASAKGLYLASINGERLGEESFRPGWTDYHRRIQFQTHDVTDALKSGANVLGITLAEGWYCGHVCWFGRRQYGPLPEALLQLDIVYEDGKTERIVTDGSWQWSYGKIASADLLMGETHDFGADLGEWEKPGFDASAWKPVKAGPLGQAPLVAQPCESVVVTREIEGIAVTEPKPGVYVFDLGQNIVGHAKLSLKDEGGSSVVVRHGEMLNPDGTLYTTNLRGARATDEFRNLPPGALTLEPHFTFHGFRYIELSGLKKRPPLDAVHGVVLGQGLRETGTFECSHPDLNHLHSNIVWGQRGNYLEVPTDCPQRDERLGWMGDAQIFARTATFNMDVAAFLTKWLDDVVDSQTAEGAYPNVAPNTQGLGDGAPGWADAGVIVPWVLYRCYGDERILERHYDSIRKYVDFIHRWNPNLLWRHRSSHNFGDWLSIEADTPRDLLATAFFARSTDLLARMADILGREEDKRRYEKLFQSICGAFNKEFVTDGVGVKGETQTGYVLALAFDLLPEKKRQAAIDRLSADIEKRGHLSTGFIGAGLLLPTLTRFGRTDIAYKLLLTETFPSWLFPLRHGATTIWERWDGWTPEKGFQDPGMNSFNHYAFGAVGEWMHASLLGIDIDPNTLGYDRILFHPRVGGGLTWAKGSYDSIRGRIESDWRVDGKTFQYRVRIPAGSSALVVLPSENAGEVKESGSAASKSAHVKLEGSGSGESRWLVGSGEYQFECPFSG